MRIALVHDWLTGMRGGERVLDVIAQMYPDAELHTLFYVPGSTTPAIEARRIHVSPLDRLPGRARHYRKALPLFPWAVRKLDVGDVDLVISTSHAVAKSVRVPAGAAHLSYCFTPMRYAWDQLDAYLGNGVRRFAATPLIHALRAFDVRHSGPNEVDRFVAISRVVADRILRAYGREARVLHPPVDTDLFRPNGQAPEPFYLMVAGFVPYKAEAIAIDAFSRSGRRLIVVGDGPLRTRLAARAGPSVTFPGRVDDARLADLYARCRALIYPQEEDFGLVAVEAQAAGRPVIALNRGGVLDTVVPLADRDAPGTDRGIPPTGLFFESQDAACLAGAVDRFEAHADQFNSQAIRHHAERFGIDRFREGLRAEVEETLSKALLHKGKAGLSLAHAADWTVTQ